MEQVVDIISRRHPSCRIFFFGGGQSEMDIINSLVEKYPNSINASANLGGLRNELTLMSHLDVMVSMDSSNMHMASLVGCPVVSVWGATHPSPVSWVGDKRRQTPYRWIYHAVLAASMATSLAFVATTLV